MRLYGQPCFVHNVEQTTHHKQQRLVNKETHSDQLVTISSCYSQFVLAWLLGVLVALYAVDLAEHDVLEAVGTGPRVLGVPLAAVREPILSQRRGQHQPELIPCNNETFVRRHNSGHIDNSFI